MQSGIWYALSGLRLQVQFSGNSLLIFLDAATDTHVAAPHQNREAKNVFYRDVVLPVLLVELGDEVLEEVALARARGARQEDVVARQHLLRHRELLRGEQVRGDCGLGVGGQSRRRRRDLHIV